jgi:genome maintenance exonuclease 1
VPNKSLNVYGGRLTFNEDAHIYEFNGTPVAGVTSILRTINKPALIQWAASLAANHVKNNWREGLSRNEIELLCREAATAHNKVKNEAAGIGTEVHAIAEASLKGKPMPAPSTEEALRACNAFMDWRRQHEIKLITAEQILFSKQWWYAGTADIIAHVDGQVTIADIKTSSGIYPEMFMQIAAYTNALEEMRPEIKIQQWMIVRLDKKSGALEVGRMARQQVYIDAFLRCRELAKAMQTIEELKNVHLVTTKTQVSRERKAPAERAPGQRTGRVPKRAQGV